MEAMLKMLLSASNDGHNILVKSVSVMLQLLMTLLLFYAAEGVVITGLDIASRLNISSTFVGLVLIAIGTSVPELAATVAAIVKKKTDLVVGNVIGSNILNIVLVIPIIGFFSTSDALLDKDLINRDIHSVVTDVSAELLQEL